MLATVMRCVCSLLLLLGGVAGPAVLCEVEICDQPELCFQAAVLPKNASERP